MLSPGRLPGGNVSNFGLPSTSPPLELTRAREIDRTDLQYTRATAVGSRVHIEGSKEHFLRGIYLKNVFLVETLQ